jgi:hypothetical protein
MMGVTSYRESPTVSGLLELAARCEREEPSQALNHAIHDAVYPTIPVAYGKVRLLDYTTSLDAAVTLYKKKPDSIPTDPMLVCAAALRARAADAELTQAPDPRGKASP